MSANLTEKYPHLQFRKHWQITSESLFLLGQCEAFVLAISKMPILPDDYKELLNVSLVKGAKATTAIEGNTLTEEEIKKIQEGEHVLPSKEYQEIEVKNILEAFNRLLKEVVFEDKSELISPDLIKEFHIMVGKNLGDQLDAIPGKFRNDARNVGLYKCPDHIDVPGLVIKLCDWILKEFHYPKGQKFHETIIQAIVVHIYLEWIHPFGDGNGRTGRLLEFYILLRGGNPDIASHILSNHYNQTRSEYYRQIEISTRKRDLTEFIQYAIQGLRDGLLETLKIIQGSLMDMTWQKLIHDKFAAKKYKHKEVFRRQRDLMLNFPTHEELSMEEVALANPRIAKTYGGLSSRTLKRDLDELIEMELIKYNKGKYKASVWLVMRPLAKQKN